MRFRLCILLMAAAGCVRENTKSSTQEFYRISDSTSSEMSFRLARAKDTSHKVFLDEKSPDRNTIEKFYEPVDYYTLKDADLESVRVEFNSLTDSQFQTLLQTYGSWSRTKSSVLPPSQLGSSFTYQLADFLPPIVQAIIETGFAKEAVAPGTSPERLLLTNCWSSLFSIFLQAQSVSNPYRVFVSASMEHFFEDDKYSSRIHRWIARDTNEYIDEQERNKDLKPGDVLLIGMGAENNAGIYHVALFVDDDLYFEKTGPSNRFLARFITYKQLMKTYPGKLFTVRRMKETPLPPAENYLDERFAIRDVQLDLDPNTGRAKLPASAYSKSNSR